MTRLFFVTGANAVYFPTLLATFESFLEQVKGQPFYVCDYGLLPAQQQFFRSRGLLLERPPWLSSDLHPYQFKAALYAYLQNAGIDRAGFDALVWLDGDLTLMDVGLADFTAVAETLTAQDLELAACPDRDHTIGGLINYLRRSGMHYLPFQQLVTDACIDPAKPYHSNGVFICNSMPLLQRWCNLALAIEHHHLIDQNTFNVVLHRSARPVLALDLDTWQAQGDALDGITLIPPDADFGQAAFLGDKPVKILHATSPQARHLFLGEGDYQVKDLVLNGVFKLMRRDPLMSLQLRMLGRLLLRQGEELVRLGICRRAATPIGGYNFSGQPVPTPPRVT